MTRRGDYVTNLYHKFKYCWTYFSNILKHSTQQAAISINLKEIHFCHREKCKYDLVKNRHNNGMRQTHINILREIYFSCLQSKEIVLDDKKKKK